MFSAHNMSYAARRAAKAAGMGAVQKFEIVENVVVLDENDPDFYRVVIRAYDKRGNVVNITAGDVYYYQTVLNDAPMARIVR
ncbi:MAG: hypothetical protein WBC13_06410 [Dokdonella sp.]|nr:hypothetical protein [Cellvibrionales bacterium]